MDVLTPPEYSPLSVCHRVSYVCAGRVYPDQTLLALQKQKESGCTALKADLLKFALLSEPLWDHDQFKVDLSSSIAPTSDSFHTTWRVLVVSVWNVSGPALNYVDSPSAHHAQVCHSSLQHRSLTCDRHKSF